VSVKQLCGGQCTEETIELVRRQLLRKQSGLLSQKANIEAKIRRFTDLLQLENGNLEKVRCELGKVQCELDELDCLEKAAFICHDMSALKIRLDFLEKIHSNKRKNKVNPNDNLKLSLSIIPIEHKMLLYK